MTSLLSGSILSSSASLWPFTRSSGKDWTSMMVTMRPNCCGETGHRAPIVCAPTRGPGRRAWFNPFRRLTAFLLTITTGSLLAWSTVPTAVFVGRVVSTQKVNDVSIATNSNGTLKLLNEPLSDVHKEKTMHWEIWKAEVEVKRIEWLRSNQVANLADKVSVYYEVDWSTNFMTPYGPEAGHPPRPRLNTNKLYHFTCNRLDTGTEPNAFRAFDGGITPR